MIALILAGAAFLTLSHGLHRPAAPPGRMDRHARPEPVPADRRADGVLHRARLLPGRHLDGGADHGRDPADGQAAGIDPLWFGIFIVLVVEMAQITPPVGFNLFVLQGMTGREIAWIARVTLPFFLLMVPDGAAAVVVPADRDLAALEDVTSEVCRATAADSTSSPAALHVQVEPLHESQALIVIEPFEAESSHAAAANASGRSRAAHRCANPASRFRARFDGGAAALPAPLRPPMAAGSHISHSASVQAISRSNRSA